MGDRQPVPIRPRPTRVASPILAGLLSLFSVAPAAAQSASTPRPLEVVLDDNYPPFAFRDAKGELQGIAIDQWRAWQQRTGVAVAIHGMDWSEALRRMRGGEFDVIDTVFHTPERSGYLEFGQPYARLEVPIFFRQGITGITDLASLKGFAVAAKSGDTAADRLREADIAPVLLFNNYEAIVKAAGDRKVNVFVMDKPPALYFLNRLGIADEFRMSDPTFVGEFRRAVRKGDAGLLQLVEQGFLAVGEPELGRIASRWQGGSIPPPLVRELRHAAPLALALLGLLLGWNWTLARQVKKRTLALRQSEAQIRSSEDRLRSVLDGMFAYVGLLSKDGLLLECNRAPLVAVGKRREEVVGRPFAEADWFAHSPEVADRVQESIRRAATGEVVREDLRVGVSGGALLDVDTIFSPLRDAAGEVSQIVVSGVDISQRRQAELRIAHLNRVYAVLSEINETIVREKDPQALLEAASRIAVETGKFRMAWIGMIEAGSQTLRPAASAGVVDGYLDVLAIDLRSDTRRGGPTGQALATGAHAVCCDLANDPSFAPWREEAVRRGYRASAAFPLRVDGKVVGAFNLYASELGSFDDEELRLLDELAMDISFALEVARREEERRAAEERHARQRDELVSLTGQRRLDGGDVPGALRMIAEAAARTLDVARVSIWRYNEDRSAITCAELFELTTRTHSDGAVLSAATHPAYFRALAQVEVVAADDAVTDPRTSEFAAHYLLPLGIGSMLDVPIHVGGELDGVMCHEHLGPRHWTADEKTFAVAMANLVSLNLEGMERRQVEAALHASEERLRRLAENLQEVLWMTDPSKREMLYVSPAYERIWGRPCADLYASPGSWLDPVHPEDRERVSQAAATRQISGDYDETYRIVRPDGAERWIRDRAFPVRATSGEVLQIVGAAQDITVLRQAEQALRASEARYRSLFESAPDGIFVADPSGACLDVNLAAQRMLGYSREELLGRTAVDAVVDSTNLEPALREIRAGAAYRQEWRLRRRDGSIFDAEVRGTVMPDGSLLGQVRDVSESKRAEVERAQLEAQLRQSQKMDAIGRLAGGVAHDFNNMLGVILGHTERALGKVRPVDPLHKSLQAIRDAAQRSAALTRQLLGFSRQQAIAPRILDLNEQVAGMEHLLHRLIGEDIELQVVTQADLWPVLLDPSQVDQVVANLAVNARDAMPDGGTLTFRTANVVLDETYCAKHAGARPGDHVMLAVADTGSGMDERTRERAFEPFFTTKPQGKGTGLGLATIYGIVKQNDGFVEIESALGKGTSVRLYLPRSTAVRALPPPAPEPLRPTTGRETVLLVEDQKELREIARLLLEEAGYAVLEASNGADALAVCETHPGPIDLLLTDVVMPRMNGRELAERVRGSRPHIRTLFTSGYASDTIGPRGVLEPGIHFLQKPFTLESLAEKVREVLA